MEIWGWTPGRRHNPRDLLFQKHTFRARAARGAMLARLPTGHGAAQGGRPDPPSDCGAPARELFLQCGFGNYKRQPLCNGESRLCTNIRPRSTHSVPKAPTRQSFRVRHDTQREQGRRGGNAGGATPHGLSNSSHLSLHGPPVAEHTHQRTSHQQEAPETGRQRRRVKSRA